MSEFGRPLDVDMVNIKSHSMRKVINRTMNTTIRTKPVQNRAYPYYASLCVNRAICWALSMLSKALSRYELTVFWNTARAYFSMDSILLIVIGLLKTLVCVCLLDLRTGKHTTHANISFCID